MIPIQPYFVFSTYHYDKRLVMQHGIAHFYHYHPTCHKIKEVCAIPDGCTDLFFERDETGIKGKACGSVLKRMAIDNQQAKEYFGIRFMPGVLPANLSVSMKELVNNEIDLSEIIKSPDLLKQIQELPTWEDCMTVFVEDFMKAQESAGLYQKSMSKVTLVESVKQLIYKANGNVRVQELSDYTGYSTRYINKVFEEHIGMSPKAFEKIVQLQNALQVMNHHQEEQLIEVGMEAGYFDQAHFIKDFKRHMLMTPTEYKKLVKEHHYLERLHIK